MAWELFEKNGKKIQSGDKPIDEIALSLEKLVKAYTEDLERKPIIEEILYAIETVIGADPERYVSDPKGLELADIIVNRQFEE